MRNLAMGLVLVAALAAAAGRGYASVIVQYSFPSSGAFGPTVVDPDVTAGDVTSGGSLATFVVNSSLAYSTTPVLQTNPGGTVSPVVDTAFANNNFFQFTIAPNTGFQLDLAEITFVCARGGSSTPRRTGVRTSLTGSTTLASWDVPTVRPNWTTFTVDLSTYPALQNVSGPVTFLLAVATPSSGNSLEFDNITVSGTVTPEPATMALVGLGLAGLIVRRGGRQLT